MKLLSALIAVAALAADPPGFGLYTNQQIEAKGVELKGKVQNGLASEKLGDWGNHYVQAIHREATGQAEFHERWSDVLVIRKGEGSIIVGGTVVGGKETADGEIRGERIEGGETRAIKPGDIVHIPPKTPHQVVLKKGQRIDYIAMKVEAK
jgi:mannose-6-phosphate isomerase-like protein (cupin superfamily)